MDIYFYFVALYTLVLSFPISFSALKCSLVKLSQHSRNTGAPKVSCARQCGHTSVPLKQTELLGRVVLVSVCRARGQPCRKGRAGGSWWTPYWAWVNERHCWWWRVTTHGAASAAGNWLISSALHFWGHIWNTCI